MAFLDNLVNRKIPPDDAAVSTGVATLHLSGEFTDLERRLIGIFRDQYPSLSVLEDTAFEALVEKAVDLIENQNVIQDVSQFVQEYLAPAIATADERAAAYRYAYALAMANLNVDPGEQQLLDGMKSVFALSSATVASAEAQILAEFAPLHKALAAIVVGFIVVTADGQIFEEELTAMHDARTLLEPIARLDDNQFTLVYDLGLSIYNRFLTDPDNRSAFLYNVVVKQLNTRDLRVQAFHYAASVATADGDLAKTEVDTLKDILHALQLSDAAGEAIFKQYMDRVKTIDGKPVEQ
ncbi:MAG: TerB family tellurite resistance protein [Chloroflexota bacterium]